MIPQHQQKASSKCFEPTLFFGGIEQGWHIAAQHFSIIGETGSGKTLTLRMLLKSVLQRGSRGASRALRSQMPVCSCRGRAGTENPDRHRPYRRCPHRRLGHAA